MDNDILVVANEMQANIEAEADAIHKYGLALECVDKSTLDEATKDKVNENIAEIISDELNHIKRLYELYSLLTGIEPNKD